MPWPSVLNRILISSRNRFVVRRRQNIAMVFESVNFVSCRQKSHQAQNKERSYEDAVEALNRLVSNAATLKQTDQNDLNVLNAKIPETIKYLKRAGMTLAELDQLKIIHVAGTKGKGSTCALVESILRYQGLRTGFFSSPHLVSVTERIRLQGLPISQLSFTKYFWIVFDRLKNSAQDENDMPPYFQFLTVMSFYVFLNEHIDVAIMEVGIGGEYDSTNILPNTKTVGITSLGLDHLNVLGDTIEKIAWQKAGIIKEGSDVFTVSQDRKAYEVIQQRAAEKKANLFTVPHFNQYKWTRAPLLQFDIDAQKLNISLAIQLALNWMHHFQPQINCDSNSIFEQNSAKNKESLQPYQIHLEISEKITTAIERCHWPGRCQHLQYKNFNFYIDGAHTLESIEVCSKWFKTSIQEKADNHKNALIFNVTGGRDVESMLKLLNSSVKYDIVCFTPNLAVNSIDNDLFNQSLLDSCQNNCRLWKQIQKSSTTSNKTSEIEAFTSVFDTLSYLSKSLNGGNVNVLVTGSLHLVGAFFCGLEKFDNISSVE